MSQSFRPYTIAVSSSDYFLLRLLADMDKLTCPEEALALLLARLREANPELADRDKWVKQALGDAEQEWLAVNPNFKLRL